MKNLSREQALNKMKELEEYIKNIPTENIMERVKTFDDVCRECGTTEDEWDKKFKPLCIDSDTINYEKLKIIAKALNEGWTPDWNDSNEYKYYPWFKIVGGFGFSGSICDYFYTFTFVGSRLCFKSEELAIYAGKQFTEIYKNYLT